MQERPIYVIDTNVLVDYPNIIPDPKQTTATLPNHSVELAGTHRVIPSAVIRELSSFKAEYSERGKAAREVLKNMRAQFQDKICGMKSAYAMGATVELPDGGLLTALPVHADFKAWLPFRPAEDDMDGQIILTAIAVMHLEHYKKTKPGWTSAAEIDWGSGSESSRARLNITSDRVVLLTNDNGLALRAMERGVRTERYTCDLPKPYTGRRDVVVPEEIFAEFYEKRRISREIWEGFMPNEERLVANE